MPTLNLQNASLDDIVFEGRNKEYGAYALRQAYHRHLKRALAIAVTLFALLLIGIVAQRYLTPAVVVAPPFVPDGEGVVVTAVVLPPKTQPAVARVILPRSVPDVATRVAPDHKVVDQPKKQEAAVEPIEGPVGQMEVIGVPSVGAIGNGKETEATGNEIPAVLATPAGKAAPFISVEVMPEFAGGQQALIRYLQKNLHYPPTALREQVEGKVFVSFTVDNQGAITDVQVVKGLGYGTDEEAARVIRGMPRWEPGRQNNQPVSVRYTLPISFNMTK